MFPVNITSHSRGLLLGLSVVDSIFLLQLFFVIVSTITPATAVSPASIGEGGVTEGMYDFALLIHAAAFSFKGFWPSATAMAGNSSRKGDSRMFMRVGRVWGREVKGNPQDYRLIDDVGDDNIEVAVGFCIESERNCWQMKVPASYY